MNHNKEKAGESMYSRMGGKCPRIIGAYLNVYFGRETGQRVIDREHKSTQNTFIQ